MPRPDLRRLALALALLLVAGPGGCSSAPGGAGGMAPSDAPPVALEPGAVSGRDRRRAEDLVREARQHLARGAPESAREAAALVVERYPSAPSSGEAAWILARALDALDRPLDAEAAAARYASALPPGDGRRVEVLLFQADRLEEAGDREAALDRLLRLPLDLPDDVRRAALERVRAHAGAVPTEALGAVLRRAGEGQPLATPAMVAWARALLAAGEREEAERWARAALDAGATGEDREAARALASGRAPGAPPVVRLGAVLPLEGSPALRRFAAGVEEGMRAAAAAHRGTLEVELLVRDDRGDPSEAARLVEALEREGVLAVVGPLEGGALAGAAGARRTALPLVSPTAVELPAGAPAVFSLGATDPGAAHALAAWASRNGLRRVVILHPLAADFAEEAALFAERHRELGGSVLRTVAYPRGTAYFKDQLELVRGLRPQALVLPVPVEDALALAPQVTFFGLDAAGITVLGTAAWTADEVLRDVSRRHTDGVVAATPASVEGPGHARFVEAYEALFRRSLRDPIPALGWDAASLLLLAFRSGARTPAEVARALEEVRDFPGATGVLSVEGGRIVREHHVVCLQGGTLVPLGPGGPAAPPSPPPPGELPAEGVGRPCPGAPAPPAGKPPGRPAARPAGAGFPSPR